MKNLILALSALLITTSAQARSIKTTVSAEILNIQTQAGSLLAEQTPVGGEIVMNVPYNTMSLVLRLNGTCPQNAVCIWAGPAPLRYNFTIAEVSRGACGETIIRSHTQPLEEGGPMATLTVTDYSTLLCKYMPAAWVEAELQVHGFINEVHTMTAEKFQ